MRASELQGYSHRRFNPLTREWVLVSPHRTERPWQGQTEAPAQESSPAYDPDCYLCPGNLRAGGVRNPAYTSTFVFENDFAALTPDVPSVRVDDGGKGLLVAQAEAGICRVVCFSPRHDLTLSRMPVAEIELIIEAWAEQFRDLGARPAINYVQIFENRGAVMGCSNPHPHGQIWANATVPNEPNREQASLLEFQTKHSKCLLCEYMEMERGSGERLVCENQDFLVVVPFWAVWPFEVLLLSKRHVGDLCSFTEEERTALAEILKRLTTRYDNLFQVPFPYSMGFHQKPTDGADHKEWHFHGHFYPPLLRSATVKKFMVGYEMLASPQRDITAEGAAEKLRSLPEEHYSARP